MEFFGSSRYIPGMSSPEHTSTAHDSADLATLRPLARQVHNIDFAVAEIARFSAELTLPKGTIHIISDIHGEDKKLRHIINNASGTLRPLVERLLKGKMPPEEFEEFLTLIFLSRRGGRAPAGNPPRYRGTKSLRRAHAAQPV